MLMSMASLSRFGVSSRVALGDLGVAVGSEVPHGCGILDQELKVVLTEQRQDSRGVGADESRIPVSKRSSTCVSTISRSGFVLRAFSTSPIHSSCMRRRAPARNRGTGSSAARLGLPLKQRVRIECRSAL